MKKSTVKLIPHTSACTCRYCRRRNKKKSNANDFNTIRSMQRNVGESKNGFGRFKR